MSRAAIMSKLRTIPRAKIGKDGKNDIKLKSHGIIKQSQKY
jgi:hypothetical protein